MRRKLRERLERAAALAEVRLVITPSNGTPFNELPEAERRRIKRVRKTNRRKTQG